MSCVCVDSALGFGLCFVACWAVRALVLLLLQCTVVPQKRSSAGVPVRVVAALLSIGSVGSAATAGCLNQVPFQQGLC